MSKKTHGDKPRLDLFPPEALIGAARVLAYGAKKYGARDWERGNDYGKYYAAALRHLLAWWGGEENDRESGLLHLDHAACNLALLRAMAARGIGRDDRQKNRATGANRYYRRQKLRE